MRSRSRRKFIAQSAGVLGAGFACRDDVLGNPPAVERPQQPNVLLIIADQQRADTPSFRGISGCRTPNLDRLAREGMSFDRCLTPSPLCLPARTGLFTGLYPHQTRTMSNKDTLEAEPVLLTRLRAKNYQLDYAGKWGMGESNAPRWVDRLEANDRSKYSRWCQEQGLPDGWAFNDPAMRSHRRDDVSIPKAAVSPLKPEQMIDAWIVDHAIRLLDTRDRRRPFFLTCAFEGPHPPFKVPEPYFSMYDPGKIPQPPNFGPSPGEPRALSRSFYRTVWRDHGETWAPWQKTIAAYWGFVSLIDAQIGRLIKRLEQEGVLDQTLVVVSADHGEMLGQHGLWQKYHAYQEALRIPLVMRAPWLIKPGTRSLEAASLIDLMPTILPACGASAPTSVEGVDLAAALSSSSRREQRRLLFSEFKPKDAWHGVVDWRLVTDNRHKYVWNRDDIDELYDLSKDPYELTNLAKASDARSLVKQFRTDLRAWLRRTDDPLLDVFESQHQL